MKIVKIKPKNITLPHNVNNTNLNRKLENILLQMTHWQGTYFNKEVILNRKIDEFFVESGIYLYNTLSEDGFWYPVIEAKVNDKEIYILLDKNDELLVHGTKKQKVRSYQYGNVIPTIYRQYVLKRDGHCCLKCKTKFNLSIDHILPKSRGGTNSIFNLQTLCTKCNSDKSTEIFDYREMKTSPMEINNEIKQTITIDENTIYEVNKDGTISHLLTTDTIRNIVSMEFTNWLNYFKTITELNCNYVK